MKRMTIAIVLAALALFALGADEIVDNEFLLKSVELKARAEASFDEGDYDAAADYAAQSQEYARLSDEYIQKMLAKRAAETAIALADDRMAWAVSVEAEKYFPEAYALASETLDGSKADFGSERYPESKTKAEAVLVALQDVKEQPKAPPPPLLPASYKVRSLKPADCLWRIAGYAFVYGNPLKWPVLYEANKKSFRDPGNPDLIFPGQIIMIPSLTGEPREGLWDASIEYGAYVAP